MAQKMQPDELEKITIESNIKELEYRRNKQWKIFSWASSILAALLAGTIAADIKDGIHLDEIQRGVVTLASLGIGFFSWKWLGENWKKELEVQKKLEASLVNFPKQGDVKYGYAWAILLLVIGDLIAIWQRLIHFCSC